MVLNDETMTVEEMWDTLLTLGVSEETLQCVTNMNGYSKETMQSVLYCGTQTGCRSFSQLEDENEDELGDYIAPHEIDRAHYVAWEQGL